MPILQSKVIQEPSVEPVDLDDIVKIDLRVDDTIEDDIVDLMIKAARQRVESMLGASLITQTRTIKMDYFPTVNTIKVLYGPLQSVETIKYYDSADQEITMDQADYWVDPDTDRIVIKNSWPATYDRPSAVTITYKAGYGDDATLVPADIKKAILYLIAHFYENRQAVIVSGSSMGVLEVPFSVEFLLANYVRYNNVLY